MNDDKHASHRDSKRDAAKMRIPKHGRRLGEIYRLAWEKRAREVARRSNEAASEGDRPTE